MPPLFLITVVRIQFRVAVSLLASALFLTPSAFSVEISSGFDLVDSRELQQITQLFVAVMQSRKLMSRMRCESTTVIVDDQRYTETFQ